MVGDEITGKILAARLIDLLSDIVRIQPSDLALFATPGIEEANEVKFLSLRAFHPSLKDTDEKGRQTLKGLDESLPWPEWSHLDWDGWFWSAKATRAQPPQ